VGVPGGAPAVAEQALSASEMDALLDECLKHALCTTVKPFGPAPRSQHPLVRGLTVVYPPTWPHCHAALVSRLSSLASLSFSSLSFLTLLPHSPSPLVFSHSGPTSHILPGAAPRGSPWM